MTYAYVLGMGIAALCEAGIGCMNTIDFKASELIINTVLWPVALVKAAANRGVVAAR